MNEVVENLKAMLGEVEEELQRAENRLAGARSEYEDHGRHVDEALQRRNNWRARRDALIDAIDELGGDTP